MNEVEQSGLVVFGRHSPQMIHTKVATVRDQLLSMGGSAVSVKNGNPSLETAEMDSSMSDVR